MSIALKDSAGNIVADDVYTAGSYKDVYTYTQVNKTLYAAGSKFNVLAYSKLAEKVYRKGNSVTIPYYNLYTTAVYLDGGTMTLDDFVESSSYYESDGADTMYYGNGSYVRDRGDAMSGTNLGMKIGITLYRTSTDSDASYKKVKEYFNEKYLKGTDYSGYKGGTTAGYLRGGSKACYFRKATAAKVFVKSGQSTYNIRGDQVNPSGGTQLYTHDAAKDKAYDVIGAEVTGVYERDEDGDYEVTPINPNAAFPKTFTQSDDYARMYELGKKCTLEPATVVTQEVVVLAQ